MVDEASGTALKGIAVDQGICGREPDSSPDYAAIGHMYFDSVDAYRNAFGPHAVEPSKAGPLMRGVNGYIGPPAVVPYLVNDRNIELEGFCRFCRFHL
jgi:hypothetical protein